MYEIDIFGKAYYVLKYKNFRCSESGGIDPQTRLLMEKTAEITEHGQFNSNIGVYIGCMYTEYLDGILGPAKLADSAATSITGHGLSFMVGRMSFTFGWQGPCISTDTACSSSLVSLHLGHTVSSVLFLISFFSFPSKKIVAVLIGNVSNWLRVI